MTGTLDNDQYPNNITKKAYERFFLS